MARYASPYGNRMAVFESEREKRRRRRASRETLPPVRYGETRDTDLALIDKVAERGGDQRGLLRALRKADNDWRSPRTRRIGGRQGPRGRARMYCRARVALAA
jgi:hypothetical protein